MILLADNLNDVSYDPVTTIIYDRTTILKNRFPRLPGLRKMREGLMIVRARRQAGREDDRQTRN